MKFKKSKDISGESKESITTNNSKLSSGTIKKIIALTILVGIVSLYFVLRNEDIVNKDSTNNFEERVYANYQTNLENYKEEINQSITVNGVTMNIKEVVLQNSGLVLAYTLTEENGTIITKQTPMSVRIRSEGNNVFDGKNEYLTNPDGKNFSSALAVFISENSSLPMKELIGTSLTVTVDVYYQLNNTGSEIEENRTTGGETFIFQFTPSKIYEEKVIEIKQAFQFKNEPSTIQSLTSNGLYMKILYYYPMDFESMDYESKDYEMEVCYLKVEDEFGTEIEGFSGDIDEERAFWYYDILPDNTTKIYLTPNLMVYEKDGDEKLTPIGQRIEVIIPEK